MSTPQQNTWANNMSQSLDIKISAAGDHAAPPSLDSFESVVELVAVVNSLAGDAKARAKAAKEAGESVGKSAETAGQAAEAVTAAKDALQQEADNPPAAVTAPAAEADPEAGHTAAKNATKACRERHKAIEQQCTKGDGIAEDAKTQETDLNATKTDADTALAQLDIAAKGAASIDGNCGKTVAKAQKLLADLETKAKKGGAEAKAIDINAERAAMAKINAVKADTAAAVSECDGAAATADGERQTIETRSTEAAQTIADMSQPQQTLTTALTQAQTDIDTAVTHEAEARKAAEMAIGADKSDEKVDKIGPFTLDELKFEIDKEVGPIKIKDVGINITVEGEKQVAKGTSGVKVSQGVGQDGIEVAVEKEVTTKLSDTFDFKEKAGGKANFKGVSLEVEGMVQNKTMGACGVSFVIIGVEWKEGDVQLAELTLKYETPDLELGEVKGYKIKGKGSAAVAIEPNWAALGREMAKRYGPAAVAEVGLASAFLAGGVMTIVLVVHTAQMAKELPERVDKAAAALNNACASYKAVLTGGSGGGGPGADVGAKRANEFFATCKQPKPEVVTAAKARNLSKEAFGVCMPTIRAEAIKAYWEEHYIEKALYGEKGAGGGFRTFKRTLDAALKA